MRSSVVQPGQVSVFAATIDTVAVDARQLSASEPSCTVPPPSAHASTWYRPGAVEAGTATHDGPVEVAPGASAGTERFPVSVTSLPRLVSRDSRWATVVGFARVPPALRTASVTANPNPRCTTPGGADTDVATRLGPALASAGAVGIAARTRQQTATAGAKSALDEPSPPSRGVEGSTIQVWFDPA